MSLSDPKTPTIHSFQPRQNLNRIGPKIARDQSKALTGSTIPAPFKPQLKPRQNPNKSSQPIVLDQSDNSMGSTYGASSSNRQRINFNQSSSNLLNTDNTNSNKEGVVAKPTPEIPGVLSEIQQHMTKKILTNLDIGNIINNGTPTNQRNTGNSRNPTARHVSEIQVDPNENMIPAPPPPLYGCFTDIFNDEFFNIVAKAGKNMVHSAARESLTVVHEKVGTMIQEQVKKMLTSSVVTTITGQFVNAAVQNIANQANNQINNNKENIGTKQQA